MKEKSEIQTKNKKLECAFKTLTSEYVGLQKPISKIIDLIRPWYLFPKFQERPLVINLWGLTSTGKTSLILRLVDLLDLGKWHYYVETQDLEEKNFAKAGNLTRNYESLHKKPAVLTLDEFQNAATLDDFGQDINGRNHFFWRLIGSGLIETSMTQVDLKTISESIELFSFILQQGVTVENGRIKTGLQTYIEFSQNESYMFYSNYQKETQSDANHPPFIPLNIIKDLYKVVSNEYQSKFHLKKHFLTLNGKETIAFIRSIYKKAKTRKTMDCSKFLVFIVGNLDKLYKMNMNLDPDIDADRFHEESQKLTVSDVKNVLSTMIRSEQISRLGNNHIIFPAFCRDHFVKIIISELQRIQQRVYKRFDIKIEWDDSLVELIYDEGVYPTQGTRPLFSTIQYLFDSTLSKALTSMKVNNISADYLLLDVDEGKIAVQASNDSRLVWEQKLTVDYNLRPLRKKQCDDKQALIAVHESGHAVASIYLLGKIPRKIISSSLNSDYGGKMILKSSNDDFYTQDTLKQHVAYMFAGLAAEKMIFGEKHVTNGSQSDIVRATTLVGNIFRRSGFADRPGNWKAVGETGGREDLLYDYDYSINKQIGDFLKESQNLSENTVKKHKDKLLKLANYLSDNRTITRNSIIELLKLDSEQLSQLNYSYRKHLKQQAEIAIVTTNGNYQ